MKNYLFIALAMLCHTARAQDDAKPTIYFNSGKTITAEKIRLRMGALNNPYLLADGKHIQTEQVKFFENDRGFFANTRDLSPWRINGFAERVDQGSINLFREMPRYRNWENEYDVYDRQEQLDYGRGLFYNKGLGNLKTTTYANLSKDLSDNQQSMDFLAAYRKKRKTATIFFGIAGASILASFVTFFNSNKQPSMGRGFAQPTSMKLPYFSYALAGVGVGFSAAGALNYVKSKNELMNAVDAYNR